MIERPPDYVKLRGCGRALKSAGWLILFLSVQQFPVLWLARSSSHATLDQVMVAILLVQLGVSTWYAGGAVAQHQRWGFRIASVNVLAMLVLTFVHFAMTSPYYVHGVQLAGVVGVSYCLMALALGALLLWVRAEFRDGVTG